MKKGWIVLGSAMLLLLPVSACMGVWAQDDHSVQSVQSVQSVKYPEPPRSKDVPGHLVWNEDTGAYYDPEEFEWDPVNRVYKEKFIIDDRPIPDEWLEPVDEWIKRHENSKNPVEQALVKFYKDLIANQTTEDKFSSQFLTPAARKALRHLVELGPEYVDEMLKMIEHQSRWSMTLIHAIQEIEGLSSSENQYFDPTPEGMKQWAETFRAWKAGKA